MTKTLQGAVYRPFFLLLIFLLPSALFAQFDPILQNDGVMPPKEVEKIRQMGRELYAKTHVPVFVAVVKDLNETKPIDLIERVKTDHPTYILLYFSLKPPAVNIFASQDAKKMVDIDQILSPLPWRGTIRPIMGPGMGKDTGIKQEVAVFNGYADIVDQVAESKGVKLSSSIGSGGRTSFQIIRMIFYGIFLLFIIQYFWYKRKSHAGK
ncbi:hypothetical protein [Hydrogenimonas sp. SS33]|uniref:hypothetical protein n=1 Tax=Hydrogenimonas leucolamina TaxID=2954236 RepID=UPI00336BC1B4